MRSRPFSAFLIALALAAPAPAQQEDAGPGGPAFKEGDIITLDKIDSLKPYLPAEFWTNRDFFFYEGMRLEVGPFYRSYAPPPSIRPPRSGSRVSPGSVRRTAWRTTRPVSPSPWMRSTA